MSDDINDRVSDGVREAMKNEVFKRGLAVRRQVVGDAYVDASLLAADEFSLPIQELATKYCWGEVWTREDLSRKTRSLVNIGMITALNRPAELRHHIRGALRNGCTRVEVREVLLQTAVYCGLPAALDGFRIAREAFADFEAESAASSAAN
jgi:4-carboxymuconolactone decarboxylase